MPSGVTTNSGFEPCLTVDAAGDVTVPHTLRVEGELIQGPLTVDPTDPRLAAKLAQQFGEGITAGLEGSGSLLLTVKPSKFTPGRPWNYEAEITNKGSTTISPVAVYETVVIDQKAPYGSRLLAFITTMTSTTPPTVPKPQPLPKSSDIDIPAGAKTVEVTLTALGVGAGFGYVFARETKSAQMQTATKKK